jgi:hypothetical protein
MRSPFAGPGDIPSRGEEVDVRPPYLSPADSTEKKFEPNAYRTLIGSDPGCDIVLAGSAVRPNCA